MDSMEKEIKKKLKSQLKGATGSTIESLVKRIISLPYERMSLATEAGAMLAANNVRAAIELLKATPEVSRLTDISDLRVWGETCKRLSANAPLSGTAKSPWRAMGAKAKNCNIFSLLGVLFVLRN